MFVQFLFGKSSVCMYILFFTLYISNLFLTSGFSVNFNFFFVTFTQLQLQSMFQKVSINWCINQLYQSFYLLFGKLSLFQVVCIHFNLQQCSNLYLLISLFILISFVVSWVCFSDKVFVLKKDINKYIVGSLVKLISLW